MTTQTFQPALSPGKMFESQNDGVIEALPCSLQNAGAAANVVAAITGKRIRIVSGTLSGIPGAAIGAVAFTGGAVGSASIVVGPAINVIWPYNPAGWYETTTGAALQMAGAGGGGCFSGTYIAYTP